MIVFDANGKILKNQLTSKSTTTLPKTSAKVSILSGDDSPANAAEIQGWMAGSTVAYLGRSIARCVGGFIKAPGASRSKGSPRDDVGWIQASKFTDQAALRKTQFDAPARSIAILIEGVVGGERPCRLGTRL